MTEWDSRLRDAAIWGRLEKWEDSLEDAAEVAEDQGDETAFIAIERLKSIRKFVEHQLSNADAFLVSKKSLERLAKQAKEVSGSVGQYASSGDSMHLVPSGEQNAAYHGDRMVILAQQIPGAGPEASLETIRDTVRSVRGTAAQNLRRLREDVSQAQEEVRQLKSEAEEAVEDFKDAVVSDLSDVEEKAASERKEIEAKAHQKLSTLEEKIEGQRQRITDALDRFEDNFDKAQSEREADFEESLGEWEAELEEIAVAQEEKSKELLQDMEEDRDRVEKLMGVIGASGRARGFEKQANYERRASYVWRALAVLALLGLVGAAWWLAQETVGDAAVDWYAFSGKFTLLGAIGVLAGYAIKQGRGHLGRAESNRKLQLELTSIRPFLAGFPDGEEREILRQFAPRWFGNVPTEPEVDDETMIEELRGMAEDSVKRGSVTEDESDG